MFQLSRFVVSAKDKKGVRFERTSTSKNSLSLFFLLLNGYILHFFADESQNRLLGLCCRSSTVFIFLIIIYSFVSYRSHVFFSSLSKKMSSRMRCQLRDLSFFFIVLYYTSSYLNKRIRLAVRRWCFDRSRRVCERAVRRLGSLRSLAR